MIDWCVTAAMVVIMVGSIQTASDASIKHDNQLDYLTQTCSKDGNSFSEIQSKPYKKCNAASIGAFPLESMSILVEDYSLLLRNWKVNYFFIMRWSSSLICLKVFFNTVLAYPASFWCFHPPTVLVFTLVNLQRYCFPLPKSSHSHYSTPRAQPLSLSWFNCNSHFWAYSKAAYFGSLHIKFFHFYVVYLNSVNTLFIYFSLLRNSFYLKL